MEERFDANAVERQLMPGELGIDIYLFVIILLVNVTFLSTC